MRFDFIWRIGITYCTDVEIGTVGLCGVPSNQMLAAAQVCPDLQLVNCTTTARWVSWKPTTVDTQRSLCRTNLWAIQFEDNRGASAPLAPRVFTARHSLQS